MKLKLKNTPEQIALIQAMGHRDNAVALPAIEAFAAVIGPTVQKILQKAGTSGLIYSDYGFNEDDTPVLPVELFYNEPEGYITIWYQTVAGGLPTNVVDGGEEMKFTTFRLDTAIAWDKKYARKSNLPVIAKGLERMSQEILLKQERNGWSVIFKALAEATTNSLSHVIGAGTAGILTIDDFNKLLTRGRRINTAWDGGTPMGFDSRGITDVFMSPEIKEQIRSFAYQPMNTRAIPNTDESTALGLPDSVREQIFRGGGMEEIYGIQLTEMNELGLSQRYSVLFDNFYSGTPTFDNTTQELLVGFDLSREAFLRPIATNSDTGNTFVAEVDDQWVKRSDRFGYYGHETIGFVVLDSRALAGLIV